MKTWMPGTRLRQGSAGPTSSLGRRSFSEGGKAEHDDVNCDFLVRPDRERADRDDMAIAIGLDAVGERLVDGVLLARRFQRQSRPSGAADCDRVPAAGIVELAEDVV